jgi:hypothetical protein
MYLKVWQIVDLALRHQAPHFGDGAELPVAHERVFSLASHLQIPQPPRRNAEQFGHVTLPEQT